MERVNVFTKFDRHLLEDKATSDNLTRAQASRVGLSYVIDWIINIFGMGFTASILMFVIFPIFALQAIFTIINFWYLSGQGDSAFLYYAFSAILMNIVFPLSLAPFGLGVFLINYMKKGYADTGQIPSIISNLSVGIIGMFIGLYMWIGIFHYNFYVNTMFTNKPEELPFYSLIHIFDEKEYSFPDGELGCEEYYNKHLKDKEGLPTLDGENSREIYEKNFKLKGPYDD